MHRLPDRALRHLPIALLLLFSTQCWGSPIKWQSLGEPGSGGANTSVAISPFDGNRLLTGGDMLGIGLSTDGGKTWQATFGLKSYEIGGITWSPTDPNTVWAGTMGGPWLSTDGGRNWHERRAGMPGPERGFGYTAPIETVLFDPRDSKHLLAFGGSSRRWDAHGANVWGAVWESKDAGGNWTKLTTLTATGPSSDPKALGLNIVGAAWGRQSPYPVYLTTDGAGFWASSDSGKTWEKRNNGLPHPNVERVYVHPKDASTVFVSLSASPESPGAKCLPGGVYKTSDGGCHWSSISNGLRQASATQSVFTSGYKGFAIAEKNPDVMYASDTAWDTGTLYTTRDGGAHWKPVATKMNIGTEAGGSDRKGLFQIRTAYPAGIGEPVLAVDPKSPDVCLGVGAEEMVVTRDGGKTWASASSDASPNGAFKGRGFSGLCSTNFRFDPNVKGHALLLAMDAGKCWETKDGLKTWTFHGSDPWPWGGGNDATFAGKHIYVTTGQFGQNVSILRTKDGVKWDTVEGKDHGLPGFHDAATSGGIYARPDSPEMVWAIISGCLYRSTDAGDHWSVVHRGPNLGWIAADPKRPGTFYVSGEKNVYRTDDGEHFTPIGGPHQASRMAVAPDGALYIAADNAARGGLWRYANGKWTRLWDDAWIKNVAVDPTNPKRIAFTTSTDPFVEYGHESGVWVSGDGGESFEQANDGLAMLRGHAIAFNPFAPEYLMFGSFGRGFFSGFWPKAYVPKGRHYQHRDEDTRYAAVDPTPEPPDPAKRPIVLVNGSMTAGTDVPTGWNTQWVGRGKITVSRDTSTFKAGPASLCITTVGDAMGQTAQTLDAAEGARFTLTGYAKSAGSVKVNVAVQAYNAGWTPVAFIQCGFVQNEADWTAFSKDVVLPAGTAHIGVVLLVDGNGKAWLDEVGIKQE